jgi:hypothetical protein
VKVISVAA